MIKFSKLNHQPSVSSFRWIIWRCLAWVTIVFLLPACANKIPQLPHESTYTLTPVPEPTQTPSPTSDVTQSPFGISEEAKAYLDEALDLMQKHSINKEKIDWESLQNLTYHRAYGAQAIPDTYQAVQYALADLGTNHSYLMTPDQVAQMEAGSLAASIPGPEGRLIKDRIGYVYLPSWAGTREFADKHATEIQKIIQEVDAGNPCGWILDLRENSGGAMWPMLAGIGPIVGEGIVGYAIAPDGSTDMFSYQDGQALLNGEVETEVLGEAYYLNQPLPSVAVLTGPSTCSSGEAIAIAFRERPNTRSFGKATAGLSTGTMEIELSDGAWLILAHNTFADRTGGTYGSKVVPDEIVHSSRGEEDAALMAAVNWLLKQPACILEE